MRSNKRELKITGFVGATDGWFVLERGEEGVIYYTPIVGWLLTVEQMAFPVSPMATLDHLPDTTMMLSPSGQVFNRLGDEFSNIKEYVDSLTMPK